MKRSPAVATRPSDSDAQTTTLPAPALSAVAATPARRRIALVTEELSSSGNSGGIGGAFHELAVVLAREGHHVDLIFVPVDEANARRGELETYYAALGISVLAVPFGDYVWPPLTADRKAYGLCCFLRAFETGYDFIHFHDYKGLGFYVLSTKQQQLGFAKTTLVVQAHGPTRWALEANGHPFSHDDQLKIDFMERASIARADLLVSPSQYLVDWFRAQRWAMPPAEQVRVIQNICAQLPGQTGLAASPAEAARRRFNEIIFFGRHEERKGIVEFCDAIDRLAADLAETGVTVTFLGRFGEINNTPSALYLARRTAGWQFPLRILPDYDRKSATAYLAARPGALVVIASPVENSPYAVMEAIVLGKPLITSSAGGAPELLDAQSAVAMTCDIAGRELHQKLASVLQQGLVPPKLRIAPEVTRQAWLALHRTPHDAAPAPARSTRQPSVTAAIVHHERPEKLVEAVLSLANQTYRNMDILVIDDGSHSEATHAALARLQPLFEKLGVRLIKQPNLYLGAARNRAARESKGDYLLFFDDDDIAFPTLVQTLVTAATATDSAVVTCLNLFMEEGRRSAAFPFPDDFEQKVSYLPLGGPISMAPLENCFGAAVSLITRNAFDRIGGYSELYGVGHEDYELYVRLVQAGETIEICPIPLYLYEVGRPSMISTTSRQKNFNRVATAVDLGHCPAQTSADLISLLAGKRAREHCDNFREYSISISPNPELLRQVLGAAPEAQSYPELVTLYAGESASDYFVAAMQALANERRTRPAERQAAPKRIAWPTRFTSPATKAKLVDSCMLGALVDLEFGRTEQAIDGFKLSLERRETLGSSGLLVVRRLTEMSSLVQADFLRLAESLCRVTLSATEFTSAAPYLLRIALSARDPDMLNEVVERAAKFDEAAYLNAYQDVAEAVRQGAFPTGLGHFLGRPEEQRRGFALSARLTTLLGDPGGLLGGPGQLLALAESAARRMRLEDLSNEHAQQRREAA